MIGRIQNYLYGEKVRQNLANRLIEECGQQLGEWAWDVCIRITAMNIELGLMPKDFFDHLRRSGLSLDDSSIALLDASITALKDANERPGKPDMSQTIEMMEKALDKTFLGRMGQVVPRNGIGSSLDEFTTDGS